MPSGLFKVAGQIRTYGDPEKAGPGFCLWPVIIDSDNDEEKASMGFSFSKYPDLSLDIYNKALTPDGEDKPLLERTAKNESQFDIDVLRKGNVALAGMKGQQWLAKGIDDHDKLILRFRAESMRSDPALSRPFVSLTLRAGGQLQQGPPEREYIDSSLTPAKPWRYGMPCFPPSMCVPTRSGQSKS